MDTMLVHTSVLAYWLTYFLSISDMTSTVLGGTLNPTHSLDVFSMFSITKHVNNDPVTSKNTRHHLLWIIYDRTHM